MVMADREAEVTRPIPPRPLYVFLLLLVAVMLHWFLPAYRLIRQPYNWLGIVPLALGGWITLWADQVFKRRGTTVKPHLRPSVLVTDGPFRFSRHPMYLGMTMFLGGISVLLGSLTAFIAPAGFALVIQAVFIPLEERALEQVFGEQYAAYRARVRAWL
jgi:protein-S-isoprenylcysteine O-methyltransferase Ste14